MRRRSNILGRHLFSRGGEGEGEGGGEGGGRRREETVEERALARVSHLSLHLPPPPHPPPPPSTSPSPTRLLPPPPSPNSSKYGNYYKSERRRENGKVRPITHEDTRRALGLDDEPEYLHLLLHLPPPSPSSYPVHLLLHLLL